MADRPPPTEFEIRSAKRAAERLVAIVAQLAPRHVEYLKLVAHAFVLGTDEESTALEHLITSRPNARRAIAQRARAIVDAHESDAPDDVDTES